MKLLLDTHILIALMRLELNKHYPDLAIVVLNEENRLFVSSATLWEIAIKVRLKKLEAGLKLHEIPSFLDDVSIDVLPVTAEHALFALNPLPPTRDPFDRLLLAQAQIEGMRFVTVDRALADHPVTFR